ncbi:MAG: response regulator [Lachnospiraceae bacterium]|nr:response regulator [Lachnospiraceae bacterium]
MNKKSKETNISAIAIAGALATIAVLFLGTLWVGQAASKDASRAVRNVSLLFLDELAGRREQVVASKLDDYINDMNVSLGLMEKDDLASIESLQAYQAKIKQLYGLEKFAFVDTEGLIYTSMGTRTDIDQYSFDYNTLSEPEVSIKNVKGNDKTVIIAVPMDRVPVEDRHLVVCFMEIGMENMLEGISLGTDNNSTTFCNIYTAGGAPLTDMVLGGLASEANLLDAMGHAECEAGYSIENVSEDFRDGREGVVSFTYNGIRETLYYVPIRGTDWMLTYLIRESVITEQINTISRGIITRSLVQSLLTALVLAGIFIFMILQIRRNSRITLEKEVSETENRVKQQELEEQLALQEELLDQEKRRAQQDSMITAMASDYSSVYYVDLDSNEAVCYRNDPGTRDLVSEGESFSFSEKFNDYAARYVDEAYRQGFQEFIKTESIRAGLANSSMISYRYLTRKNGVESYEMLRMAGVRHAEDRKDHIIHAVGVGFTDIDGEMRDTLSKNQALSDALEAAEEASKAKTVFLSNMSHEIRTPMNAIIGLDSLALQDDELSEKTRDYLNKIGTSAQHLLGLINDILDMSRIESGRLSLKNEEFSFSKLLEEVNTLFSGQCEEKGLHYNCRINGHLDGYYIGDNIKLKQVLINILGNAVKFTPEGGRVDLIAEKTGGFDGKSTLRFIIRDTGVGMSKDYIPKLFDTFSQEDETAANKYGSSGLGMTITKSIVEMMNGNIEVDSEKGIGTTFTVTVTLMDSDKHEAEGDDSIDVKPEDMTVLIVDDDAIACDHAKLILEKEGIAAETALSGEKAVEMVKLRHARREPYNLIIVDWRMPEMDGVETTRSIRQVSGDESAIIILTAYNWDDVQDDAVNAGVDSFIAKPLISGTILDEYKTALKKKNEKGHREHRADLKGCRILLAEDVEINAEIMMNVLGMKEMECEHALNGRIAVDMFRESPEGYYDAILMDMRMPEMDGEEACQTIRSMERPDARTIPIIALTANAFDEDVQRSLQAGMNAHLSKPVQPETLFETLEKML